MSNKKIKKIIDETVVEAIEEVNAISAGGGSLQSSDQISGTGGNPLGRDMSDQHEIMWSGDEPEDNKNNKKNSLNEEHLDEDDLEEFNAMGTGAVVGYTLPLGMKPNHGKKSKKKKRPKRWYDVHKEGKSKYKLRDLFFEGRFELTAKHAKDVRQLLKALPDKKFKFYLRFGPQGLGFDLGSGKRHYGKVDFNTETIEIPTVDALRNPSMVEMLYSLNETLGDIVGSWPVYDIAEEDYYDPDAEMRNLGALKDIASKVREIEAETLRFLPNDEGEDVYEKFKFKVHDAIEDITWFHATLKENLDSIMKKGLLPSGDEGSKAGWSILNVNIQDAVYLTHRQFYAEQIAESLVVQHGKEAVILEVDGDALKDYSKLVLDEDALRDPRMENMIAYGDVDPDLPSFYTSIEDKIASVGYRGIIKPQHIKPAAWMDLEGEFHDMDELKEEYIGSRGGVSYFQMGGSLPDELYNKTKDGKPTRDPGVAGIKKKK